MKFITIGIFIVSLILISNADASEELRIGFPVKTIQLDPQKIEDMYSMTVVGQLYAKLFRYMPNGSIQSDIVDHWDVSDGKTTYTFHLKKVYFSDGTEITAHHVENSLKRIFYLKSALTSDFSFLKGAKSYAKTNILNDIKVFAKDNHTLVINTEHPTGLLIYLLAVPDVGVLKIKSPTEDVSFNIKTAFSGAYKLTHISSEKIELKKWRTSILDSENPPAVVVLNLFEKVDPVKLSSGLISDTSNFMTFDESKSNLEKNSNWRPVASEATNERFIVMNPSFVPLKVRKWLMAKINSADFIKTLSDNTIEPAFGFIPNILPGHLKSSKIKPAGDLILDKPLTIKIIYGENLPYVDKFRSYLLTVWKNPGLKFEFEALPVADYLKILFQKKGQIVIGARGIDYPEGYSVVSYFRSNTESNFFFVNNKKVDELLDSSSKELNEKKRTETYELIQELVLHDATVVPLAFGSWKKYYWSNRVKEVPAHPLGVHFVPFEMLRMEQ